MCDQPSNPDPRSRVAAAGDLLERPDIAALFEEFGRPVVADAVREAQDWARQRAAETGRAPSDDETSARARDILLHNERDRLRPVVNATGVILHTGLGRAVLPPRAARALGAMACCVNLQMDMATGARGKRNDTTERLLCRLTGAEAALMVTNNAAATLLILTAFAKGREAIVSRGQLIEIGGSFRLPDCIHQSGATMVEVGTTNKTHLRDYERALNENTAVILKCNPSNYRIVGFSKSVPTSELVGLKRRQPVVVVDDLGCGALVDLSRYGLPKEPTVQESIQAGADLVCFSGDKLIGGPQAGIVVGRKALLDDLRKHPLVRMLRVGKLTDMAMQETLRLFLDPDTLPQTNPTYAMLAAHPDSLRRRARRLARALARIEGVEAQAVETQSVTGGGSLPATPIPSWGVALQVRSAGADDLSRRLRAASWPVAARIEEGRVVLDMRTILAGEEKPVERAVVETAQK